MSKNGGIPRSTPAIAESNLGDRASPIIVYYTHYISIHIMEHTYTTRAALRASDAEIRRPKNRRIKRHQAQDEVREYASSGRHTAAVP